MLILPYKVVWTKQEDIVDILNFLCKYKSLAYVFLPRGGMHYKGAKKHTEERFIEHEEYSVTKQVSNFLSIAHSHASSS